MSSQRIASGRAGIPLLRSVCLISALAAAGLAATPAAAQRVPEPFPTYRRADGYTYYREYHSKRPIRGHEGFYGTGPRLRYCSYIRIPHRECRGGRCRVTSWTLQQTCN